MNLAMLQDLARKHALACAEAVYWEQTTQGRGDEFSMICHADYLAAMAKYHVEFTNLKQNFGIAEAEVFDRWFSIWMDRYGADILWEADDV